MIRGAVLLLAATLQGCFGTCGESTPIPLESGQYLLDADLQALDGTLALFGEFDGDVILDLDLEAGIAEIEGTRPTGEVVRYAFTLGELSTNL